MYDKLFNPFVFFFVIIALVFGLSFAVATFETVDEGERTVVTRLGKVDRVLEPGFHMVNPLTTNTYKFEVRTQKIETTATAASKDLQTVNAAIALQYSLSPESVGRLYSQVGTDFRARIIDPAIQDIVKAATAKFNAEALITQRAEVKAVIEDQLRERLLENGIVVQDVDIVNFEFSGQFNAAIEAKVTAEQEAQKAENDLKRVEFEAQQDIEKAKAEAEKTRLEVQALQNSSKIVEKIQAEAQLEAAKRWNGALPTHMYGSAPLPLVDVIK